jgi:hypothetical protein
MLGCLLFETVMENKVLFKYEKFEDLLLYFLRDEKRKRVLKLKIIT